MGTREKTRKEVAELPRDVSAPGQGAVGPPRVERRSGNRVANEQGSGRGAGTALSKLKMLERKKVELNPQLDRRGRN